MDDLESAALTAVHTCLSVQPDESCVVVTDSKRQQIGTLLYEAASDVTDDAVLISMQPGEEHGGEPPAPVAGALKASDVFFAPTTKSLSHTRARSEATNAGARGSTLPAITETVFTTGLNADYDDIARQSQRIYEAVASSTEIRVTGEAGTDITFTIGERDWHQDTGIVHDPGQFSNLPAGEVFVSPETATGTYVVDGTIRPHGLLDPGQTVEVRVEDGYAVEISDPAVAESFERAARSVGRDAYNLAELGIGTNTGVTALIGSVLLDEKAAGTVHIALGDDAGIGGDTEAPIHADGVIRNPTVTVDGEPLDLPRP